MQSEQNVQSATASSESAPVEAWAAAAPTLRRNFEADAASFSEFWLRGLDLLSALPEKPKRRLSEQAVAERILGVSRFCRSRFVAAHGTELYGRLTGGLSRHVRVEELAAAAAALVPGLVPSAARVQSEAVLLQKNKDGHELDQGILFNRFLADRATGLHLCHSMLRPHPASMDWLERLSRDGRIDLGAAIVERRGKSSVVALKNSRYLNAEDDGTLANLETAVDLALLDPGSSVCVLRGAPIAGGKYDGQGVFCTGINLTRLYHGKIPYLWYLIRDLGFVNKIFRGLAGDDDPDEPFGQNREKPWIALVEKFAIGGGCQTLLACDYVLAASDAYMTLPARKEGIIPGAANLRLTRFVGDRIARQLVMYDRRLDCDSPDGRLICDEVADPRRIEQALDEVVERFTSSGVVSAASNRRAFRIAQEPLDLFRAYMAVYAREQAYCHFSPALIENLERYWHADRRAA